MATEAQKAALDTLHTDATNFFKAEIDRIDTEVAFLEKVRKAQGLDGVQQEALETLTDKAMDQLAGMV